MIYKCSLKVCKQNLKPTLPTATRILPDCEADDVRSDLKGKDGGGGGRNRTPKKNDSKPEKRETPKKNTCVLGSIS